MTIFEMRDKRNRNNNNNNNTLTCIALLCG